MCARQCFDESYSNLALEKNWMLQLSTMMGSFKNPLQLIAH